MRLLFADSPLTMGSFRKMAVKPDKSTIWLGKYLSLALTLPASVVGGLYPRRARRSLAPRAFLASR